MKKFIERLRKNSDEQKEILNEMDNQPKDGWDKVEPDTLLKVRNYIQNDWQNTHFAYSSGDGVYCYSCGGTSKTTNNTMLWNYAMLLSEDD